MVKKKNESVKLITLDKLTEYTQEFLNKLFPVHHILLTKVAPDAQGFPFLADLIDNSEWLPLENNRMLRIMSNTSLGGGDFVTLTEAQMPKHSHRLTYDTSYTEDVRITGVTALTHGDYNAVLEASGTLIYIKPSGSNVAHSVVSAYQGIYGFERVQ